MMVRGRGRLLAPGIAALALTSALTGCGTGSVPEVTDVTAAEPSTSSSPTPGRSDETSPRPARGATTEESPPAEQPAPAEEEEEQTVAEGIRGKLLSGDELPGFDDRSTWREESTRMREGRSPFGTCHKFAMTSIGALKATVRSYLPKPKNPGSTASHLVAEFADKMTAKRAYEVLKSWREQCESTLETYERSDVGRLEPVSVGGAAVGNWYLLAYGPADDPGSSYFDAQGLVRVGKTVSVLQMRLGAQGYEYPAGKEPMVAAVQRAAARIG